MVCDCDVYGTYLASEDGMLGDQAGKVNLYHIPEDVCSGHLCPSMHPASGVQPLGANQGSLFIISFNNYSLLPSPEQEIRVGAQRNQGARRYSGKRTYSDLTISQMGKLRQRKMTARIESTV